MVQHGHNTTLLPLRIYLWLIAISRSFSMINTSYGTAINAMVHYGAQNAPFEHSSVALPWKWKSGKPGNLYFSLRRHRVFFLLFYEMLVKYRA
uniref:Secreted protein n=1 Tax=Anopheles darlingi TaxID=43151 RepID=A0A2M4DL99_ANODA